MATIWSSMAALPTSLKPAVMMATAVTFFWMASSKTPATAWEGTMTTIMSMSTGTADRVG
jgi:hypothetical protein